MFAAETRIQVPLINNMESSAQNPESNTTLVSLTWEESWKDWVARSSEILKPLFGEASENVKSKSVE